MDRLLDLHHPFFAPLWRRVLIVALCVGWAVVEFVAGSPLFGVLSAAIGLYAGYVWFFDFHPRGPDDKRGPPP